MFTKLVAYYSGVFNWFKWLFTEIWRQSVSFIWSIWSVVLVVFGMVAAFMDWLVDMVGHVLRLLDSLVLPSFDLSCGSAIYYLELANTILPVSETFAFLVIYGVLLSVLVLYRGIKSIKGWVWAGG